MSDKGHDILINHLKWLWFALLTSWYNISAKAVSFSRQRTIKGRALTWQSSSHGQATGATSRSSREAQANLAASANLLILVLLVAAAARRHSRSVPAQRSKDRHAPTPHLQRASSLFYPNLQKKLFNSIRNVLLFTSSHTCPQHATSSALVANREENPRSKNIWALVTTQQHYKQ